METLTVQVVAGRVPRAPWQSFGVLGASCCNEAAILSVSPNVTLSTHKQLGCGDLMLGSCLLEPISHAVCYSQ